MQQGAFQGQNYPGQILQPQGVPQNLASQSIPSQQQNIQGEYDQNLQQQQPGVIAGNDQFIGTEGHHQKHHQNQGTDFRQNY